MPIKGPPEDPPPAGPTAVGLGTVRRAREDARWRWGHRGVARVASDASLKLGEPGFELGDTRLLLGDPLAERGVVPPRAVLHRRPLAPGEASTCRQVKQHANHFATPLVNGLTATDRPSEQLPSILVAMALYIKVDDGHLLQMKEITPGPELYEHEVEMLLWHNLEDFLGESLFRLRRQAPLPSGGIPDILALDRSGRVVIIEVKRDIDRHQLSQALEYAGWARSTNLDELADLYERGQEAFFREWVEFTQTSGPVTVNKNPVLVLAARDVHPRTSEALQFLINSGLPVAVVLVSVYEDGSSRRFIEVELRQDLGTVFGGTNGLDDVKPHKEYFNVRIAELVQSGYLHPGTEIVLTRNDNTVHGNILEDGNIAVGQNIYSTPSAAGIEACGHSVDGWVKWRVPSLNGVSLAELRTQYLDKQNANKGANG